ncbi:MAG TPA: trimethylamine methyltransferase family protein, partial [Thermoleophilia bacterium]|nr:trimethylamine methyltransferase family protein [Thermoleophilia bacterium]
MTDHADADTAGSEGAPAVQARPILTTRARLALRVLSDDDVARVHAAALELLGTAAAAAEAAARSAPPSFVLAGRVPEHDVVLGAGNVWLLAGAATAGTAAVPERVRRLGGGDSVPATANDLDEAVRLADALPEVALVAGPPLRAAGVPVSAALARCLAATSKHVVAGLVTTVAEAETAVQLAAAAAGSAREARRRPPLSLCGGAGAVDAALVFARAGLPVGLVLAPADAAAGTAAPSSTPAATAEPAARVDPDLDAALVRHHAGVLAGCAAVQAAAPGAPFFYVADPQAAGLASGGPEASLFQLAAAQLATLVGLPVVAGGLRTTSHEPDWQACQQDAFVSMTTTASGADVTGGAGLLGAAAAFSPQQLVMDSEIFSWNAFIASGIR